MKIRPLADRIVVKPIFTEKKLESGIIIPKTRETKESKGEVIEVGPDIKQKIEKGDMVLFGMHSGTELIEKGVTYKIIPEIDLLAVLEE